MQWELLYRCRTSKSTGTEWPWKWKLRIDSWIAIWLNLLLIRNRVVNSSTKVIIKTAAWCTKQYPISLGRKRIQPMAIMHKIRSKWQGYRRRDNFLSQVVRWQLIGFFHDPLTKNKVSFIIGTNRWSPSPGERTSSSTRRSRALPPGASLVKVD